MDTSTIGYLMLGFMATLPFVMLKAFKDADAKTLQEKQ